VRLRDQNYTLTCYDGSTVSSTNSDTVLGGNSDPGGGSCGKAGQQACP
jgi:hypothetical protein